MPAKNPETSYHSTLYLLTQNNLPQAPQTYWENKQITEVPSTHIPNHPHKKPKKKFYCCYSDTYNQIIKQQKQKLDQKRKAPEWWGMYGQVVMKSREEMDGVRCVLGCAASLHNRLLSWGEKVGSTEECGGVEVLQEELRVLLLGVKAYK